MHLFLLYPELRIKMSTKEFSVRIGLLILADLFVLWCSLRTMTAPLIIDRAGARIGAMILGLIILAGATALSILYLYEWRREWRWWQENVETKRSRI